MQLSVRSLTKRVSGNTVLENVSLDFPRGSVTALLGIQGAGKTTLLRCLTGLTSPDSGEVLLDGQLLEPERLDLRRRLMFVPAVPPVLDEGDMLEHVAMHLTLWEADRPGIEQHVAGLMLEMQLTGEATKMLRLLRRPIQYKAALLSLLAVSPAVWLVDDLISSGLEDADLSVFCREARAAAGRGSSVIYSTQSGAAAAEFSDHIVMVGRGGLRLYDTEAQLQRNPAIVNQTLQEAAR